MNASTFNFELDSLVKSDRIFSSSREEIIRELGKNMCKCLDVGRVNVWMFDDEVSSLECIGNFSQESNSFSKGEKLHMKTVPNYYQRLKSDRILLINDIDTSEIAKEIREIYCIPNSIGAMMDLPIRMEGKLEGVLCFENTSGPRYWSDSEVQFANAVSQVVALAFETRKRRKIQIELMHVLQEKEMLLKEMHHRIKNNLSILIGLLRLQSSNANDAKVEQNLAEAQKRIFSMAKIHEQLYKSGKYLYVELAEYIDALVTEYDHSVNFDHGILFERKLERIEVETSLAINLGLIVIEVLNNSLKHAFKGYTGAKRITILLQHSGEHKALILADNGIGFDVDQERNTHSIGMTIVEDLVKQFNGKCKIESSGGGTNMTILF